MPRKTSSNTRLKKELLKKLMKMSIQIDSFVYKNQAITTEIAQQNLQEINYLRECNCHDARTLQVIEKLTRHMNNIIAESKPRKCTNYPIKEANLTLTCMYHEPNVIHNAPTSLGRDVTSPSLLRNDTQKTIDLTASPANIKNKIITSPTKLNLASFPRMSQDIFEESQNILQSQKQSELITIPTIEIGKCQATNSKKIKRNSKKKYHCENVHCRKDERKNTKKTFDTERNKSKPRARHSQKEKKNKPTKSNAKKNPTHKSRHIRKTQSANPSGYNVDNAVTQYSNEETFYSTRFTRSHIVHNSYNSNPGQLSNTQVPCQKVTETDLSWVENIKYVRQVLPENYDPGLGDLIDSFWENCTFSGLTPNDFHIY